MIPVQHSPSAKDTRSKRDKAFLTPTERAPLDCTPSIHQLSKNMDRGPPMEGASPSRRGGVKSRRSRSFPDLLNQIFQNDGASYSIHGELTKAVAPRNNYKDTELNNPSMKAPYSFDGTQAHKLRRFIQSRQLIFHNDPANFFSDSKKALYSTSFLTGRAGKWI
ncbi:hypothetical protein O181_116500 [Austropuccinia psidii MF-1]|uniref:Uncharacterized protein n=1 Tax=Austropuccinia psidii MF-1 TaxID=1389203 RepID=A0A9Q3PXH0_9BASI|nr:hypothetical protein [Austropuccinia psidii MF-1]